VAKLITCEVCGSKISSEAVSCPSCGDPMTEEKKEKAIKKAAKDKKKKEKEEKEFNESWARYDASTDNQYPRCPVCGIGRDQKKEILYNGDYRYYYESKCNCDVRGYYRKKYGLKP